MNNNIVKSNKLNQAFNLFINKIKNGCPDLWKAGVYSKIVKKYKALQQGLLIETFLRKIMGGIDLDTDEKSVTVTGTNGDFRISIRGINIDINIKSIIQKKGVVLKNGNVGSKRVKIFDLSRKSIPQTLDEKLLEIGYEEIFQVYAFDVKKLKGYVFITSLSDIAKFKLKKDNVTEFNNNMLKKEIKKLFKFNGGSHYTINSKDMFNAAKFNNRILSFNVTDETVSQYKFKKEKNEIDIFNRIK